MLRHQSRRQRVDDRRSQSFESIGHQFIDRPRSDVRTRESFGQMIDRLHAQQWTIFHPLHLFHLRVRDGKVMSERFRLAEHLIFDIHLIHILQRLGNAEPHQLNVARTVGKISHQAAFRSFAHLVDQHNVAAQLNVLHPFYQIANAVHLRAVFVTIGVGVQQVADGVHAHLGGEQRSACGSDSFKISDVLIEIVQMSVVEQRKRFLVVEYELNPARRQAEHGELSPCGHDNLRTCRCVAFRACRLREASRGKGGECR